MHDVKPQLMKTPSIRLWFLICLEKMPVQRILTFRAHKISGQALTSCARMIWKCLPLLAGRWDWWNVGKADEVFLSPQGQYCWLGRAVLRLQKTLGSNLCPDRTALFPEYLHLSFMDERRFSEAEEASGVPFKDTCMLTPFSPIQLFVTLWIVAHQTSLSMAFSRQEYWSRLPWPPPGDLPDPGIEPVSLMPPALAGGFFTTSATWKNLRHTAAAYPREFKNIFSDEWGNKWLKTITAHRSSEGISAFPPCHYPSSQLALFVILRNTFEPCALQVLAQASGNP